MNEGNAPSHVIGEARIPFRGDLEPLRESMQEAERIVAEFAEGLGKKVGEALGKAIADAADQIKGLEERLTSLRASDVSKPETAGSGRAELDEQTAKLSEIDAKVLRIEDLVEGLPEAIAAAMGNT